MKIVQQITLLLGLLAIAHTGYSKMKFRTDINPALRYYQAYLEAPRLLDEEQRYLFSSEWRGQSLDQKFADLIQRYDIQFRFLREAARAQPPCDWGIDLTEGPDALLPGLAPAKAAAQTARLRVMWHLQNGKQPEARDDLLAAFTLARNISHDGVLISALVQIAMENILASVVAENFYQWKPETLQQIIAGFDAAPTRGTMQQTIAAEKTAFYAWYARKIRESVQDHPGDEPKAVEEIRAMIARVAGDGSPDFEFAERVIKAAAGTSAGVLKLVQEMEPLYDRVATILGAPPAEYEESMPKFLKNVEESPNPLVAHFYTAFARCRPKEFGILTKLAMLRAGLEYKLHGLPGLNTVSDPMGSGSFEFSRFIFNGEDRGFQLRSAYTGRGFPEILIFIEKNGPAFMIDGKNVGKAVSNPGK